MSGLLLCGICFMIRLNTGVSVSVSVFSRLRVVTIKRAFGLDDWIY
jgi:hypothetical protein